MPHEQRSSTKKLSSIKRKETTAKLSPFSKNLSATLKTRVSLLHMVFAYSIWAIGKNQSSSYKGG
jgi:hypothetical protein